MLHRDRAALVVVDVQTKLLPSIDEADFTVGRIVRLIQGFQIVGAPILVTEQYRKGLGETDPRIREALRGGGETDDTFQPLEKVSFSCAADPGFRAALESLRRRQIVLCGIESHVCVYQTALHLVEEGFHVEIAADAVSSRSSLNREIALKRMMQEGARITSVEAAVFEMLEVCGTDSFRAWVQAIRND